MRNSLDSKFKGQNQLKQDCIRTRKQSISGLDHQCSFDTSHPVSGLMTPQEQPKPKMHQDTARKTVKTYKKSSKSIQKQTKEQIKLIYGQNHVSFLHKSESRKAVSLVQHHSTMKNKLELKIKSLKAQNADIL